MNLKIKELIYYVNMLKIMIFFYFKKLLDFVVKDFIECWKNYKILILNILHFVKLRNFVRNLL